MTKKDIIQAIAEELECSQIETKQIVQKTLDAIVNAIVAEGRAELRGFGVFELKKQKERLARNPHTGERVVVPERWTIRFKPGLALKQRVGGGTLKPEALDVPSEPSHAR